MTLPDPEPDRPDDGTDPREGGQEPDPDDRTTGPRRVRIVGVSGSGKSRLARRVADTLHVPRLELDAVFWDAGWRKRPIDDAHRIVDDFLAASPDGWVVDGGWTSVMGDRLDPARPGGADVVVWLDHSRARVMARAVRRALRRGITREELWHGNRERMWTWLLRDPDRNILRWTWTQHPVTRATMLARIAEGEPVLRLSGQRAVDAWIAGLEPRDAPGARDRRRRR